MKGDPSVSDLERWRAADLERRRAECLRLLRHYAKSIREAEAAGADKSIVKGIKTLHAFALRDVQALDGKTRLLELAPLAERGRKFSAGRKQGTVSAVRMFVRNFLKKHPKASAAKVWGAIKAKPPRGVAAYESSRLGKYIETDGAPDTGYARFANIVSEEKQEKGPRGK